MHYKNTFYVYIVASWSRVIYIGMTNNIKSRIQEHRMGSTEVFTRKYRCKRLVYYEKTDYVLNALAREKQLKGWRRSKKVALIESINPNWDDLAIEHG